MTTPTVNFSLGAICQQRKKQMLFNVPPPRYDIVSPYNGKYSQQQLDMRRKAEILKYQNNASSTKTNNYTKSQKWAQTIKGNSNTQRGNFPTTVLTVVDYTGNYQTLRVQYPNTIKMYPSTQYEMDSGNNVAYDLLGKPIINKNAYKIVGYNGYFTIDIIVNDNSLSCAEDELIPTPTSSSNIPGPIAYIYNDETVPLYNYTKKTTSFSYDTSNPQTDKWLFNTNKDILLSNGSLYNILTLMITNNIDQLSYNFSLQIPFSIYVTGTNILPELLNDLSNNLLYFPNLALGINSVKFSVNYSNNPVIFPNPPTISIQTNGGAVTLINNDGVYNVPTNTNMYPLQFDISFSTPPTNTTELYYAKVYSGIINVSNILLLTEPSYIYDFNLQVNLSGIHFTTNNQRFYYNSAILSTDYGTYVNTTPASNISKNSVIYPGSPPILSNIRLTGH